MYIPKNIRVGFQARPDTFTKKLAYVIYYGPDGKIRKETSWKGWCDDKIEPLEITNEALEGYMLNKGVQRWGSYYGSGRNMVRVWDPRGFEFEITVDNLLEILTHFDMSKREILGKCSLAWAGKELVLLPTNSDEYIEATKATKLLTAAKVKTKELKPGTIYVHRNRGTHHLYLGKLSKYYKMYSWELQSFCNKHKLKISKHDGARTSFIGPLEHLFLKVPSDKTYKLKPNTVLIPEDMAVAQLAGSVGSMDETTFANILEQYKDQLSVHKERVTTGFKEIPGHWGKDLTWAGDKNIFNYQELFAYLSRNGNIFHKDGKWVGFSGHNYKDVNSPVLVYQLRHSSIPVTVVEPNPNPSLGDILHIHINDYPRSGDYIGYDGMHQGWYVRERHHQPMSYFEELLGFKLNKEDFPTPRDFLDKLSEHGWMVPVLIQNDSVVYYDNI